VCALVGVLIECLYEMHGATIKTDFSSNTTTHFATTPLHVSAHWWWFCCGPKHVAVLQQS